MENVFANIEKLMAEFQRTIKEDGATLLKQHFTAWFDANPDAIAVRFEIYTPGFNDGAPCTQSVSDFSYKFTDTDEEDGDNGDGFVNLGYGDDRRKVNGKVSKIPQEVLDIVFGDNVRVVATREGFHVEEYDCGY